MICKLTWQGGSSTTLTVHLTCCMYAAVANSPSASPWRHPSADWSGSGTPDYSSTTYRNRDSYIPISNYNQHNTQTCPITTSVGPYGSQRWLSVTESLTYFEKRNTFKLLTRTRVHDRETIHGLLYIISSHRCWQVPCS
ncbi:uncharacterized protein HD556DRAFT_709455 [Suillus plorans]|uniref:Uncharacterized protein n=1 Tax=Suillus plorans TaxID=116603 RepID=A0A9P7DTD8_9AGAM|nr:uncharacterized protein HD556DRAFT_709455 [Suillus plorans]KAG1802740.1 hypothetical protein HD556DRAFT_709455 [Suillus plorans]